jgi:hypothetical protein
MALAKVYVILIIASCSLVGLGLLCCALGFLYKWLEISRREVVRKREQSLSGSEV